MSRRRLAALTLAGLSPLAALAGCGGSEAPPVVAPTPPVAAEAAVPAYGACYTLDYAEALAPAAESTPAGAVPCARAHTSETFYVGSLSTTVSGHLVAVDSARVQRQAARVCPAKLTSYVGGSIDDLRLSMVRAVWFTPSLAESEAGATWLRCDVIAVSGEGKLASLTGSLKGALKGGAGTEAMCGTAAPGSAGFERVPCAAKHTWKALKVVPIAPAKAGGDTEAYPGESAAKAAGQSVCKAAGRDVAADALDYSWSYEWPTRKQWDAGQTYGLCWAPQR